MGRPTFFRQRILTQASSLESKGHFNYLVSEIKARREVSLEEAILIARDVQQYLKKEHLTREPGESSFQLLKGVKTIKSAPGSNNRKRNNLTVIDEEDIENMAEFGISVIRKDAWRLIEEAYLQDAILDGPRLLLFIMESPGYVLTCSISGNRASSFHSRDEHRKPSNDA